MPETPLKSRQLQESYEIGSERNGEQPNVWLPEPMLPGFRAFMMDFYWAFHQTARLVLGVIAEGIGLGEKETEELLHLHSGLNNQLRLLHYPPVAAAEIKAGKLARMPAHSDWRCVAFLSYWREKGWGLFHCGKRGVTREGEEKGQLFVKELNDCDVSALLRCSSKTRPAVSKPRIRATLAISSPPRPYRARSC